MTATELVTQQLEIKSGTTKREDVTGTALQSLIEQYIPKGGTVVLWQIHSLRWGRFEEGKFTFSDGGTLNDDYILEARVFNDAQELHVIRRHSTYTGRFLDDTTGPEREYVDSASRLWGTRKGNVTDGFAKLKDTQRFLELVVPVTEQSEYYALVTRNYITADEETGQAGYNDYRYVAIEPVKGGK